MAVMLTNQLDFIFFFYGLAFILLGTVCFGLARGGHPAPWPVLGLFGYAHGISEWLDLSALVIGDVPVFAAGRTVVMIVSFLFLFEFARLEARRLGYSRVPGRWIYLPLLLVPAVGAATGGLIAAHDLARYVIGFPAAFATGLVIVAQTRGAAGASRAMAMTAAGGFIVYAFAAGLIVPPAPFWPASVLNYGSFMRVADMPIQFVRGILACCIAFAIWAFWGQVLIRNVASPRYTHFMHQQFFRTLVAMGAILVCGWVLTDFLGDIYKRNIEANSRGDVDLVASRLTGETATVDGMVRALAGDTAVHALLSAAAPASIDPVLSLHVDAAQADFGYVLDAAGTAIAVADRDRASHPQPRDLSGLAVIQKALAGEPGHQFVFERPEGKQYYYAGYPIRGAHGNVIGVAVLGKSLDGFERDLRRFDIPVYFVDPHGVVALTNRPQMMLRALWPLSEPEKRAVARDFGDVDAKPVFDSEISDDDWITVGGTRDYVRRQFAGDTGWSLVMLTVPHGIFASRVLGIIITLQMTTLTLVYLVGRERWIHDDVQLGKRTKLEEAARSLNIKATTDALTGLYNRAKFDQQLAIELLRAERYTAPLTLILLDIDHFKRINDTLGHQAGDAALVRVSRFVQARVRETDVLARWGGEEFVILAPGIGAERGRRLAESLRQGLIDLDVDDAPVLTCSFGVAAYRPGDTPESLVARADEALYCAKLGGRNRVEVIPEAEGRSLVVQSVA